VPAIIPLGQRDTMPVMIVNTGYRAPIYRKNVIMCASAIAWSRRNGFEN
jgi:hypothetical protein